MSDAKARATGRCAKCNGLLWADNPRVLHACGGTPAAATKKLKAADIPCPHRGEVFGSIADPSCGCRTAVFRCGVEELQYCTINRIDGAEYRGIPCAACDGCRHNPTPVGKNPLDNERTSDS